MNENLTITCYTDPDGLWGNGPTGDYDVDKSVAKYQNLLTEKILWYYPGAIVYHSYEPTVRTFEIEGAASWKEDESINDLLESIVNEIYTDFAWCIGA